MNLLTKTAHIVSGFISGFTAISYPVPSSIIVLLFITYEYSENRIVHDKLFPEIREFTVGYVLGFLICFTLFNILHLNIF